MLFSPCKIRFDLLTIFVLSCSKNIYVIFYHVLEHIHPILYSHNPELFLVAMSKERATWNWRYEKGLVDTMRDHVNIPMFRGQNGWTGDGWRSMLEKFNQMFPFAHFTKQQLQEKEKELKGSWKAIHVARQESGVGWNDSLAMVIAEPEKWKKLINVRFFH